MRTRIALPVAFFGESQVGRGVASDEGFVAGMVFGKLVEGPPAARIKIHLIEERLPGQGSVQGRAAEVIWYEVEAFWNMGNDVTFRK
jgi:hypothetical protein